MIEWVSMIADHFPLVGTLTVLVISLILVGWYGREGYSRLANLEEYRKLHEVRADMGFAQLREMHEAVIELKEILKRHNDTLEVHDREILRLRDWKDRHGEG